MHNFFLGQVFPKLCMFTIKEIFFAKQEQNTMAETRKLDISYDFPRISENGQLILILSIPLESWIYDNEYKMVNIIS